MAEVKAFELDVGSKSEPEQEKERHIIDEKCSATIATTKIHPSELDEPEESECLFHS